MVLPGRVEFKGEWKQNIDAAKLVWDKLTQDEILQTEGQQQKLCHIIKERYGISREDANRQITEFRKNLNILP